MIGDSDSRDDGSARPLSGDEWWGTPTNWSLVKRAQSASSEVRSHALGELFELYRLPISRLLSAQSKGLRKDEIAVEDFFAYVLERGALDSARPEHGRFSQYIQGLVRNFIRERRRDLASSGEALSSEALAQDADHDESALIDVDEASMWGHSILEQALAILERARPEDARLLHLMLRKDNTSSSEIATALGISAADVRKRLYGARRLLGRVLDDLLRESVSSEADLEIERAALAQLPVAALIGEVGVENSTASSATSSEPGSRATAEGDGGRDRHCVEAKGAGVAPSTSRWRLRVCIDPGESTSDEIAAFYVALDALYQSYGGSGLRLMVDDAGESFAPSTGGAS